MKTTAFTRLLALLLAAALLLCGCKSGGEKTPDETPSNADLFPYTTPMAHIVETAYPDEEYGFQLEAPEKGEEIAVLHTNFGDIAIRLFPDGAPKTVANFKALILKGYYNGLSFHRIIDDFMIQTGDPNGDGTGGESASGGYIVDEFDPKLLNLRGALAMANAGVENQNGSQFFINQNAGNSLSEESCVESLASYKENYSEAAASYKEYYDYYQQEMVKYFPSWETFFKVNYYLAPMPDTVPDEVWTLYNTVGGNISLDGAWRNYGGHTVFGQVFDGMDVVDAIAAIETDEEDDSPLYKVKIETAELMIYDPDTYKGSGVLSPELIPADKEDEVEVPTPAYPLGDLQKSTEHTIGNAYADRNYGFQLEAPAIGEEIAVLHTTKGDIRIRLFPDGAPQTVANFKAHIRSGFYNGLSFHYVMNGFLIQSGDPDGDGTGGKSSTGAYIPDEFEKKLLNLRGALSMGNTGVQNTATSQFFINQTPATADEATKAFWEESENQFNATYTTVTGECNAYYQENETQLSAFYGSQEIYRLANATLAPQVNWVPNAVWDLYQQHGGNIHLDGQWREYGGNTVFGQVFDGMDVVDAIAAVATDEYGKPTEDITITSAELTTYNG